MHVTLDAVHALLKRTPGVLGALLAELPPAWLAADEGAESWSPFQVSGHLLDAERRVWIPRVLTLIERGETATFPPFDRKAHLTLYRDTPLPELLEAFSAARAESLATLRTLVPTEDLFERAGSHPQFGRVSLRQLLATWVNHDLSHERQILRVLAGQYWEAMGPWQNYLRPLS